MLVKRSKEASDCEVCKSQAQQGFRAFRTMTEK